MCTLRPDFGINPQNGAYSSILEVNTNITDNRKFTFFNIGVDL